MHLVSGWHSRGRHTPLTPPPALPVEGGRRRRSLERPSGGSKQRVLLLGHGNSPSTRHPNPPHGGNVVVFFTYKGLRGVLQIEDTT